MVNKEGKNILNIAIIGCGNIGSRHLQALSLIKEGAIIYLVDNSTQSIDISKERFEQVVNKEDRKNFKIKVRRINEIESDIDVAIIATSSLNRAMLTKELIEHNNIKYIIFEKFLFQNRSDYSEIQSLLKENGIKAWVNQWMSSSDAFQEMANWFDRNLKEIIIDGKNWGMACNSVHFLDYLDSLSGRTDLNIQASDVDKKVLKSKRPGYYELTGTIAIQSNNGVKLILSSSNLKTDGVIHIKMSGGNKRLEATLSIDEISCNFYDGDSKKSFKRYTLPMQSKTTGDTVQNIFKNGVCSLPTYEQSVKHHLILFDCFDNVFMETLQLNSKCPIT